MSAKEKAATVSAAAWGTQATVTREDWAATVSAEEKAAAASAAAEGTLK